MAPITAQDKDYYALLEVSQTADPATIKTSYKRLAMTKHPDKNRANPNATGEFQLLQEAYSTLSDPTTRRRYDAQNHFVKRAHGNDGARTNDAKKTPGAGYHGTNARKRQPTEQERAQERENRLRKLKVERDGQDVDASQGQKALDKLLTEVARLKNEIADAEMSYGGEMTWWEYLMSILVPVGQTPESEEKKAQQERHRLDKVAAQAIKESMLKRKVVEVEKCKSAVRDTQHEIGLIEDEIKREKEAGEAKEREKKEEEQMRRRRESMRRAEEIKEAERRKKRKDEEQESLRQEFAKRADKERNFQEEEAKRQDQEKILQDLAQRLKKMREKRGEAISGQQGRAQEDPRREEKPTKAKVKKEKQEQRGAEAEAEAEAKKKEKQDETQAASTNTAYTDESCCHNVCWNKIQQRVRCTRCLDSTQHVAFRCQGCGKLACSFCRDVFKGTKWHVSKPISSSDRSNAPRGSRYSGFVCDNGGGIGLSSSSL